MSGTDVGYCATRWNAETEETSWKLPKVPLPLSSHPSSRLEMRWTCSIELEPPTLRLPERMDPTL
eukprot:3762931-Rhodomonas_salina.1